MAFEKFRHEEPGKYYNLDEIRNECRKLNPGELLQHLFWLVNTKGDPVTRKEKLGRSSPGDKIVFAFQNKVIHERDASPREALTALELTGQNTIDFVEHPFTEMRQVLRDYEAVGFLKVEDEGAEKPLARVPIIGAGYDSLRKATVELYRDQIEDLVSKIEPEEVNNAISEALFSRALSRLNPQGEDGTEAKETTISLKDARGRNVSIELKYMSSLRAPSVQGSEEVSLLPGLIIRMSLPERQGERAFEPHRMPDDQAGIFSALAHIVRNPDSYPSVQKEFARLGIRVLELQTREWLEPPSKEQHRNMFIEYERRLLE
ncbi:MAG: hypothetical protein AAB605_02245 [Patescibacteria group bacterium]